MFIWFANTLASLAPQIATTAGTTAATTAVNTAAANAATNAFLAKAGTATAADVAAANIAAGAGAGLTGTTGAGLAGTGLTGATGAGLSGSGILAADAGATTLSGLGAGAAGAGGAGVAETAALTNALPAAENAVSQGIIAAPEAAQAQQAVQAAQAPQAAQAAEAINFNPASNYIPPNPNLVQAPGQYANFDMAKAGAGPTEYSPFTGSAAQSGVTIPTTVSNGSFLHRVLPDPIAQGFNDAFGLVGDATKGIGTFVRKNPLESAMIMKAAQKMMGPNHYVPDEDTYNPHPISPNFQPSRVQSGQNVYRPSYAQGGITSFAQGGMGGNMGYPQGRLDTTQYATPSQMPTSAQVVNADYEVPTDPYMGSPLKMAAGGILAFAPGGAAQTRDDGSTSYLGAPSPWNTNQDSDANTALLTPQDAATYRQKKLEALVGFANRAKSNPQMALGQMNHMPAAQQMREAQLAAQQAQSAARPQAEDVQSMAGGGIMGASTLGGYAAGGNPRLLKGPGDGMSDNIPAVIGNKQPARLADGEFVIPADVVSHLGNGSTDAGAKHLHAMMDKVRKDRTGNKKQGKQINPNKYLSA